LKASAATAAVGGLNMAYAQPAAANITELMQEGVHYTTSHTTCPYCSASCGQIVATALTAASGMAGHSTVVAGDILDIWGDKDSPVNQGGLCAKGAGAYQLVTNPRRLGVSGHTAGLAGGAGQDMSGTAWKRVGNATWSALALDTALGEIAGGFGASGDSGYHKGLVGYRNEKAPTAANHYNSSRVMFFGSSHANNEVNYLYRKTIATFGTSNTEHQARI
jgi:formate dehydrogenase major subunit